MGGDRVGRIVGALGLAALLGSSWILFRARVGAVEHPMPTPIPVTMARDADAPAPEVASAVAASADHRIEGSSRVEAPSRPLPDVVLRVVHDPGPDEWRTIDDDRFRHHHLRLVYETTVEHVATAAAQMEQRSDATIRAVRSTIDAARLDPSRRHMQPFSKELLDDLCAVATQASGLPVVDVLLPSHLMAHEWQRTDFHLVEFEPRILILHPDSVVLGPLTLRDGRTLHASFRITYSTDEAGEKAAFAQLVRGWPKALRWAPDVFTQRTATELQTAEGVRALEKQLIDLLDAALFREPSGARSARVTQVLWVNWLVQ